MIRLLRSHNLRTIFNKIMEKYPDWEVDNIEVKWLGDFYFDARYPGDDFISVNEDEAKKCLEILGKIRSKAYEILKDEKTSFDVGLEDLDIF